MTDKYHFIYQNTYSVSMDDLMNVWIDTFHSFGPVLVIWDASTHFDLLNRCGIVIEPVEAYNNKALTVELPTILDAFEVMDLIQQEKEHPFMQVYENGKLISDNLGPIH